jgi:hypothetical protein
MKTLKDIKLMFHAPDGKKLLEYENEDIPLCLDYKELKQAAIEWIKYYRIPDNQPFFVNESLKGWSDDWFAGKGAELFLMNFFNLIEDDLK